jgi:hypothetical protein
MAIAILYPVLAQIGLTLLVLIGTGYHRRAALLNRDVTVDDIALDNSRWPGRARQFANCYVNQFELPVLFYVLCLMAHTTRTADLIFVILAWIFVICRVLHAYVHTGTNVVARRGAVFLIGFFTILIMMLYLTFRLLVPPAV